MRKTEQRIITKSELVDALCNGDRLNDMRVVSASFVGDWCDGSWLVTLVGNDKP